MSRVILIKYGEIHLKGKNRPWFLRKLRKAIERNIAFDENATCRMIDGRYVVENYDLNTEAKLFDEVIKVFGIHSAGIAITAEKTLEDIGQKCIEICNLTDKTSGTFKCECKRSDKTFPLNSMELARELGAVLLDEFDTLKVDVHTPEIRVYAEVRQGCSYIYTDLLPGPGGMPTGTGGKVGLLLSGGIDSPVAGYMLARRGISLEAIYFDSPPHTSERAKQKVLDLAGIVGSYAAGVRVHVVPFTDIQEKLYMDCPNELLTVLMRRFMMRIAERIALANRCKALATGENIGQVASQTIDAIASTNEVCTVPVFRPLLCFDKVDIMDYARKIGTYETSILPFEDCCTVFVPKHPDTRPKKAKVEKAESILDIDSMVEDAIENTVSILC